MRILLPSGVSLSGTVNGVAGEVLLNGSGMKYRPLDAREPEDGLETEEASLLHSPSLDLAK